MPYLSFVVFCHLGQAGVFTYLLKHNFVDRGVNKFVQQKSALASLLDFWGRQKVLSLHIFVMGGVVYIIYHVYTPIAIWG